jgi:hypothetical protein
MKKIYLLMGLSLFTTVVFAQNVGIGTPTPQTNLHVNSASSTIIRNETTAGSEASLELKTPGLVFDFLELRKWRAGAGGFLGAIPLNGLSQITTGSFTTGGLVLGTKPAYPLYFTTDNIERMRIAANGNVGINTINSAHALQVTANNKYGIYSTATAIGVDTIAGVYGLALSPTPVPYSAGVRGESNSSDFNGIGVLGVHKGSGWGVAGFVKELGVGGYGAGVYGAAGSSLSGSGNGGFGIYGTNNNIGGSGGFFLDNDGSATSYALKTQGKLKFNGIGEAAGKVLTSDASGNASWAIPPTTTGTWTVSGANISNSNTGAVGIGTNVFDPQTQLQILNSLGGETNVTLESTVNNKNVGYTLRNPTHEWKYGLNIGNFSDGRFNMYHTSLPGGTVLPIFTISSTGNFGIGSFAAAPTERLEIKDGFIKVSGTNKTAFVHTATAANSSGHITYLSYANQDATDLVFITHNYNPSGAATQYLNVPTGVFFSAGVWSIYNEDVATPMFSGGVGKSFNVMVIKQ